MKNNTRQMLLRAGASVTSLVMVLSVTGTYLAEANASKVHSALGTSSVKLVSDGETGDTEYFKSDYSSWEDEYEHAKQVNMDVQEEGSVLLENDGTLPLKKQQMSVYFPGQVQTSYMEELVPVVLIPQRLLI